MVVPFRPSAVVAAWRIFPCQIPLLCRLYIFTACIRVSNSFSFFANSLMSSMYIRWLIFSCDLVSLYPAVHFLCMWLSGIIAIIKSNGDSASLWNITLWIFASAKLFAPAVNSTHQIFKVFYVKFDFVWYFVHLGAFSYSGLYHMPFCSRFRPKVIFSVSSCSRWGCTYRYRVVLLCVWILCSILSLPQGTICGLLASRKPLPLLVLFVFYTS